MQSKRIETFDDWKDLFQVWQKDIDYDTKLFSSVPLRSRAESRGAKLLHSGWIIAGGCSAFQEHYQSDRLDRSQLIARKETYDERIRQ